MGGKPPSTPASTTRAHPRQRRRRPQGARLSLSLSVSSISHGIPSAELAPAASALRPGLEVTGVVVQTVQGLEFLIKIFTKYDDQQWEVAVNRSEQR